jgi:uncharacterized protein YgbK (DUF1537 family)
VRAELKRLLTEKPEVVLFDALLPEHLVAIGRLMEDFATEKRPLFSVGSSGIEMGLAAIWSKKRFPRTRVLPVKQILVGSGSCSPVTGRQIAWAVKKGFAELALNTKALASRQKREGEIRRATEMAVKFLKTGRSVIIHTTRGGADKRVAAQLRHDTGKILGAAVGEVLRKALEQAKIQRVCIAGGDTSSYAARALGIEAVEMIAPLTPGAPLCRAFAAGSPVEGLEIIFKGGQVGGENYFNIVKTGKS